MPTSATQLIRGHILHFLADPGEHDAADSYQSLPDGALWIVDGRVADLGPWPELRARRTPDELAGAECFDYGQQLVLPGLVDTHCHYPQSGVIASFGRQLLDWLNDYTFPAEAAFADPCVAEAAAEYFVERLLAHGTTTASVFATVHPQSVDAFMAAAERRQLRMLCGKVMMDRHAPPELCDNVASAERDSLALIEDSQFSELQQYGLDLSASRVGIARNRISDVRNHSGIRLRDGSAGLIADNLIGNIGKSAIEAQLQGGALALQNNRIGGTGASAIVLTGSPQQPAEGLLVAGNLIGNSQGSGIDGQHIGRALIIDNRISGNPEYAIRIRNEPPLPGEISLLGNQLGNVGKAMIHLQGVNRLLLGSNHYLGLSSQQQILDGDLLPVQSLLLETTLKHGCVAQLDLLAEQQPSAPLQRAPRCGQSI